MSELSDIGILIKSISVESEKKKNIIFKKFNLTSIQGDILGYLLKNIKKEIYQKDLENFFHKSNPAISGILDRLEKNGYIIRQKSDIDFRYKKISLTNKTINLEKEIKKDLEIFYNSDISLNEQEISELRILLKKLYTNLIERIY